MAIVAVSDDIEADAAPSPREAAAAAPTPAAAGSTDVSVKVPDVDGLQMFLAARAERDALQAVTRVWAPFLPPITAQQATGTPAGGCGGLIP